MSETRPVVFLSDYGTQDDFVGVCHGVIARFAPTVRVIDLDHGIPRQGVFRGALTLAQAVPFMPERAVFMAIVDPGVGSPRMPIAARTVDGDALLVGPDNGVLSLAWKALGGVKEAVEISSDGVVLQPVSKTFHGRDVFAPAAAFLASGRGDLAELGKPVDVHRLEHLSIPEPTVDDGRVVSEVIGIDRFGNVQLNVTREHIANAGLGPALMIGGRWIPQVGTFADAPGQELAALWDSTGWLALVVTGADASEAMQLSVGTPVVVERPV